MMFEHPAFAGHEKVIHVRDDASGLKAIIALHNTVLGPAAGGCRLRSYANNDAALADVLRLSQGMSYKNAMADLPLGGGKAVILGPIQPHHRAAAFEAFGDAVDALGGAYITAQDLGVTQADLSAAHRKTGYVIGGDASGLMTKGPSRFTARGIFKGMAVAAKHAFGSEDLAGRSVVVQGIGGVGGNLVHMLTQAGAAVSIADVNTHAVKALSAETGARAVALETCLLEEADIIAPCAVGGIIDEHVAGALKAQVIAGGANNQLAHADIGAQLAARDVLYVPDYVLNAGGIIAVAAQYFGQTDEAAVVAKVDAIGERIDVLLSRAMESKTPTNLLADTMAQEIIDRAAHVGGEAIAV